MLGPWEVALLGGVVLELVWPHWRWSSDETLYMLPERTRISTRYTKTKLSAQIIYICPRRTENRRSHHKTSPQNNCSLGL